MSIDIIMHVDILGFAILCARIEEIFMESEDIYASIIRNRLPVDLNSNLLVIDFNTDNGKQLIKCVSVCVFSEMWILCFPQLSTRALYCAIPSRLGFTNALAKRQAAGFVSRQTNT